MKRNNCKTISQAALLFILIFFANPNVRMIDVLPDFVACFIIAALLEYHSVRAPFFDTARKNFIKLGIVSALRIPVSIFVTSIRSGNIDDYDTVVLFSFTFCVIEGALFYFAVRDLFSALFYLGQRSDAASLISPFRISKKNNIYHTPEKLKSFTIFAFTVKMCCNSLPEMLLLTKTVATGDTPVFSTYALYPYMIVLAFILSCVISAVAAKRFYAYYKAIAAEGLFFDAADSIISTEMQDVLDNRIKLRSIRRAMSILILCPIFTFSLRFDSLSSINLMPYFMLGILMISGYRIISRLYKKSLSIQISGIAFSAFAVFAAVIEGSFLDRWGYDSLVSDSAAKKEYLPVIFSAILCFVSFSVFAFLYRAFIGGFVRTINGSDSENRASRNSDGLTRLLNLWLATAIIQGASKLADTVFRYYPDETTVAVGNELSNIVTGLVPWFGTVLFFTSLAFLGISYLVFSSMKERTSLMME